MKCFNLGSDIIESTFPKDPDGFRAENKLERSKKSSLKFLTYIMQEIMVALATVVEMANVH